VIYSLVPRKTIFANDVNYGKLKAKPDELAEYENTAFSKMGYIEYYNSKKLKNAALSTKEKNTELSSTETAEKYQEWAEQNGWTLKRFPISKNYYAVKDVPLLKRVVNCYADMIEVDHPWRVKDASNPDLKRYLKIEKDELAGWALVGSGTKYKYQIYFNGQFPYIHQNIFHLNLGTSYPTFAGQDVTTIVSGGQGKGDTVETKFENGTTARSSADIYSRQYQKTSNISTRDKKFYSDNYTITDSNFKDPSMMGTSFRMGVVAVLIAYAIGIPSAMLMARYKGKLPDKIGIGLVTVLIS